MNKFQIAKGNIVFKSDEITAIRDYLQSYCFKKPVGTSSGHAIGEPFEKAIYNFLKQQQPDQFFKQYELLNHTLNAHPDVHGKARSSLLPTASLRFLLNRGDVAMSNWQTDQPFQEKQNDTADIVRLIDTQYYGLLDVKTFNVALNGQAPNIISAYKLAELCKILLNAQEFNCLDIYYLSIDWVEKDQMIHAVNCHFVDLFKINPQNLYINWAAAMQIQFHPSKVLQDYQGNKQQWAQEYLHIFTQSAQLRIINMQKKFIDPFLAYV